MRPEQLHEYQDDAYRHILENPRAMMWMTMGTGKTIVTLTAINTLMALGGVTATLVIAPLRVCRSVWKQETLKWEHTRHLTFSYILGTANQRLQGLLKKADVYLVNYENLPWLATQLEHYYLSRKAPMPFNAVVFDEVSKMKNSGTNRVKAFRKILPGFSRRIGLTGTPASNGLIDLHGQFLVLDDGERLGSGKTLFRNRFFYADGMYSHKAFSDSLPRIKKLVGDITIHIDDKDLDLPEITVNDLLVNLPPKKENEYKSLEKDLFLELDSGSQLEAFNAAAKTNLCLQYANGNVYLDAKTMKYEEVHDEKMEALASLLEETGDSPVLLAYSYRSDADRILKAYPDAVNLTSTTDANLLDVIGRWNRGEIKLLVGHPASMGHGLNLQAGGHHLVWFGLNWSLDLYQQFNARLARQGQECPVFCHRILTNGTLDQAVAESLQGKDGVQDALKDAITRYRQGALARPDPR